MQISASYLSRFAVYSLIVSLSRKVIVLLLGFLCLAAEYPNMELSAGEKARLEQSAGAGDANAAFKLHLFYFYRNPDLAKSWLLRAAHLRHPIAQYNVAFEIRHSGREHAGFGKTAQDAVRNLLEASSQTKSAAFGELVECYEIGYFGNVDAQAIRSCLMRGAEMGSRSCWEKLSQYYLQGKGGGPSIHEAYFWISLEANCVDPRSERGAETWKTREELAGKLSVADLLQLWKRVDEYLPKVVPKMLHTIDAPFLCGMIDTTHEAEGRRAALEREKEHRGRWTRVKPN